MVRSWSESEEVYCGSVKTMRLACGILWENRSWLALNRTQSLSATIRSEQSRLNAGVITSNSRTHVASWKYTSQSWALRLSLSTPETFRRTRFPWQEHRSVIYRTDHSLYGSHAVWTPAW